MDDFLLAFTTLSKFDLHHEGLNFWQKTPFFRSLVVKALT
jgi:hypothetical protein